MKKSRLAIVNGPELEYCCDYHCAGDCGLPHNQKERATYVRHALETFDALNAGRRKERVEARQAVRLQAKKRL